ncbi:hypothetical protein JCGZ_05897 [Jatropha curcas]|uniref:VQ domain-containing protein n=1 Tax=Jatropha curcas TaxID=180498 RepID=A0A067JBM1_JATCU|nr:hypothetical protein JCGZ_05897 [Jatropha curcas]
MSPSTPNINNNNCPPPLKINKDSHMIKKSSSSSNSSPPSSSSSSSASSLTVVGPAKLPPQGPQRHPVIIYTHSPKIIHTNPKDFMQLVQKLTGLSRPEDDHPPRVKQEKSNSSQDEESKNVRSIGNGNDDNESSSVITEENCGGSIVDGQVNSCFAPPIFDPPNPYMTNIPVFTPNSADFLCANQPFFNYTDSLFFNPPSVRSSISSSSSTLEGINELREY